MLLYPYPQPVDKTPSAQSGQPKPFTAYPSKPSSADPA